MLEENQNSKDKEETLNLTGKELEEYKTYLKFKNEIEKQNESQEDVKGKSQKITQSQGNKPNTNSTIKSIQKENGITDMNDPKYTFNEEFIERMGYKKYFMEPIDIKPIEAYRNKQIILIMLNVFSIYWFYSGKGNLNANFNGTVWFIVKIILGLIAGRNIIYIAKQLFVIEPNSTLKPKINSYNALIRDAKWVKLSNIDENFLKYDNIAKDIIKNQLYLIKTRPKFKRDKYTEVYHILNSNIYIVYGIYDSIELISTRYLGYMLVIEDEECFLNFIVSVVLREKNKKINK